MLYNHLNENERELIHFMFYKQNYGINKIARYLNRNKSTISREIKRNTKDGYYDPKESQKKYLIRRWHKNLFCKFFNKYYHGIEITINKIKSMNLNIKILSVRQVYNWIRSRRWVIKPSDKLRHPIELI